MDALASPTPEFAAPADLTFHRGCVDKLSKYRELMTANLNYTEAIGEDLMIIGDEITPVSPNVEPALKIEKSNEPSFAGTDSIVITGSMNKMNGVRIMYTVKGGVAREVGFFTSLPATVVITKTNANPQNKPAFVQEIAATLSDIKRGYKWSVENVGESATGPFGSPVTSTASS